MDPSFWIPCKTFIIFFILSGQKSWDRSSHICKIGCLGFCKRSDTQYDGSSRASDRLQTKLKLCVRRSKGHRRGIFSHINGHPSVWPALDNAVNSYRGIKAVRQRECLPSVSQKNSYWNFSTNFLLKFCGPAKPNFSKLRSSLPWNFNSDFCAESDEMLLVIILADFAGAFQ